MASLEMFSTTNIMLYVLFLHFQYVLILKLYSSVVPFINTRPSVCLPGCVRRPGEGVWLPLLPAGDAEWGSNSWPETSVCCKSGNPPSDGGPSLVHLHPVLSASGVLSLPLAQQPPQHQTCGCTRYKHRQAHTDKSWPDAIFMWFNYFELW